ncbi:MAG: 16S rRNA (cytidine(1402)-2'-O)-methyltransferase, partial [Acidobacteria bacterium]|nr:16S rRNA (cytidine(1402)-2'-O)-methyltransferase [Acidobacteriota bacterium]
MTPSGILYVVATPLGNLRDITLRALDTLAAVDLVACEDTRRTRKLLHHYQLDKKVISYHAFNERQRSEWIAATLSRGQSVALVSDAGTPLVSDPGAVLVQACQAAGIPVVPIPGPSALAAALSVSHLDVDSVFFVGFPPARGAARRNLLKSLADLPWSVIFYEAPHRIAALLADLTAIFGERECLFCRELTKLHEEIFRGTLSELRRSLAGRERIRGEITLMVAGCPGQAPAAPADVSPAAIHAAYGRL